MTSDERAEPATKGSVDDAVEHLVEVIHSSDEAVKSELRQEIKASAEDVKNELRQEINAAVSGSERRILNAIGELKHDVTEKVSHLQDRVAALEFKS